MKENNKSKMRCIFFESDEEVCLPYSGLLGGRADEV